MNRFGFAKKQFLLTFTLYAALCTLFGIGFASCNNLGDDNGQHPNNNMPVVQPKIGEGIVCGTVEVPENIARTAMPDFPTITSYKITASNGSELKSATPTLSGSSYVFALALSYGTWNLTVEALDSSTVILSQTKEITLSATEPTVNATFELSYNDTAGDGNVNLTIECPDSIASVKYKLGAFDEQDETFSGSAKTLRIVHNNIAAASYNLSVSFYGASGELLFRIDQIVNVYGGLTTDKFIDNDGAPYKIESDGKIKIEQSHIDKFALSTIFVGGTGASDTNTGTQFDPLATLSRAVALVNAYSLTMPDGGFNIFVQGNSSVGGDITLDSGKTLSIKSATAGTKYTITGAQNTFTANADLTTQDLIFDKMRFVVESGNLTMTNCSVTGNTISGDGGAINISNGTATLKNCTFAGNTTTGKGNAIYNDGELKLEGTQTFGANQDIYLAQDGSNVKPITIANTITLGTGTTAIKITPAIYANGISVLTDSSSGTLVAANDNRFAVTDQNDGGTIKKWLVDNEGKLELNTRLETVYLDSTSGSDTNDGSTKENAVKTLMRATKLLKDAAGAKIIVVSKYELKGTETGLLDFSERTNAPTLERWYTENTTGNYCSGNLITISSDTVIKNVTFDGNWKADGGTGSVQLENAIGSLLYVNSDVEVTLGTGCMVKNNSKFGIGGGICNNGTLNLSGGEISGNSASNGGGGIYNTGTITMSGGEISGNSTSDSGGGIHNIGTITMSGGEISGNSASNGGGICNQVVTGTLTFTGGTVSGNMLSSSTGKGKGIYNYGTLKMSGTAQIAENNDVYLGTDKYITITGDLTPPVSADPVVCIMLSSSTQYKAGTQVLNLTAIAEANRTAVCNKFKLLNPDGTANTDFVIKPKTGDTTQGVLANAGIASGGISIDVPGSGTYVFTVTSNTDGALSDGDQITAGSTITVAVTKGGSVVSGEYSMRLYSGVTEYATSTTKSITVPAYLASSHLPCCLYISCGAADLTLNFIVE